MLTENTITNLIRTCVIKKDNYATEKIFEQTPVEIRESLSFQAEYTRALLACGDYYSGMRLVKEFISRGLTNNEHTNILLEGLAEGRFYQECIRLYNIVCEAKEKNPSIHLLAHGYGAVLKSACQLKRLHLAMDLFGVMKKEGMTPMEYVYFELCDVVGGRLELFCSCWRTGRLGESSSLW